MTGSALLYVLPFVLVGFAFNQLCLWTRFHSARDEGQRLFFRSAGGGLVFAFFAWVLEPLLPKFFVPTDLLYSDVRGIRILVLSVYVAFLTCVLVNVAVWLNLKWMRVLRQLVSSWPAAAKVPGIRSVSALPLRVASASEWVYMRELERDGSAFQRLLLHAFSHQSMVLISLDSRKVYCGLILKLPPARLDWKDEFIEVVPLFSCWRDKDTLQFSAKMPYRAVHIWRSRRRLSQLATALKLSPAKKKRLLGEELSDEQIRFEFASLVTEMEEDNRFSNGYASTLEITDWAKVIPVSAIETASLYEERTPDQWFRDSEPEAHPLSEGEVPLTLDEAWKPM